MATSQTHYQVLNVPRNASQDAIKQAYRKKIRDNHPDHFEGEIARLRKAGNSARVYALQQRMQKAARTTQRLNEAYAVLSDTARRRDYDLTLAAHTNAKIERERYQRYEASYEKGRRTVKERSHHNAHNPHAPKPMRDGKVPWVIMGVLVVASLMTFSFLTNFLDVVDHTPFTTYVPRNATAEGVVNANDLQATSSARRATEVRRTQAAIAPTSTPRSLASNLASGIALLEIGQYDLALEPLSQAIEQNPQDPIAYMMRGQAYTQLAQNDDDRAHLARAIADYSNAINLDDTLADAYRARGTAFYGLFTQTNEAEAAQQARADFTTFLDLGGEADDALRAMLDVLETSQDA